MQASLGRWGALLCMTFAYAFSTRPMPAQAGKSESAYLNQHGGAEEYLRIQQSGPDEIRFCFEAVSSRGHVCSISGTARRAAGDPTDVFTFRSEENNKACALELRRSSDSWTVRDRARCAQAYCGTGMGIGQVRFSLRRKARLRPCLGE